jgi:hypothetical protein
LRVVVRVEMPHQQEMVMVVGVRVDFLRVRVFLLVQALLIQLRLEQEGQLLLLEAVIQYFQPLNRRAVVEAVG